MTKTLSLVFSFLFLAASCGKSGGSGNASAETQKEGAATAEEVTVDSPVPSSALNFNVALKLDKFDGEREVKILEAAELIKKVVASEEFKNRILNHKVNGKKTFVDNGGLSNAEIYKKLLEGSEKLNPGSDNTMNLSLETYHASTMVVGYTFPDTVKVWMNTKYFDKNSSAKVTTNMMHEWLHKLGFGHAQKRTANRKYSVPYAIGYLTAELAAKV